MDDTRQLSVMLDMVCENLVSDFLPLLHRVNSTGTLARTAARFDQNFNAVSGCVSMRPNGLLEEESIELVISISLISTDSHRAVLEIQFLWSDGELLEDILRAGVDFQAMDDLVSSIDTILSAQAPAIIQATERLTASKLEPRYAS